MMTIYFKNGMSKLVTNEVAEMINDRLVKGSQRFQSFLNEHGEVFLIINIDEIVYIA